MEATTAKQKSPLFHIARRTDVSKRKLVYDLPSKEEAKGYSIANNAILDNSRLKGLGFTPRYNLIEAIQRTIKILK